jgi:hypothetical protein
MSFLKNIFTSLLRIYSRFFTYFLFFKYFKSINSTITNFKIQWDRIRQISVKFTEFVNPRWGNGQLCPTPGSAHVSE